MPTAHAIIPARYASSRFPGKPLLLLHGRPMFRHVWERASRCPQLASVTLATDDERIMDAARAHGVPALLTSSAHRSGTDRIFEAARLLGLPPEAVVVNIQGDEPALNPEALGELLSAFSDPGVQAATLAHALDPADFDRPDKVKVVLAANGDALYFSRAPIPFSRDGQRPRPALGHIGIYAFSMRCLQRFVELPPSSLENTEMLEQLRLLENGIPIRVVRTQKNAPGIDRPEDVARVLPLLDP
ncbi:3-deoxy-manno-octulosonate cytidylyltransferase [Desulfovibrio sp. OttesenSCG-928-A18]|nr:3-deoxy-manno-octulosonate cytidylyltransferase [Desulfovibrio sp. OttesenSCG-928-A18]